MELLKKLKEEKSVFLTIITVALIILAVFIILQFLKKEIAFFGLTPSVAFTPEFYLPMASVIALAFYLTFVFFGQAESNPFLTAIIVVAVVEIISSVITKTPPSIKDATLFLPVFVALKIFERIR